MLLGKKKSRCPGCGNAIPPDAQEQDICQVCKGEKDKLHKELSDIISTNLGDDLRNLLPEQIAHLQTRLLEMIKYGAVVMRYYENYRATCMTIALGFMAGAFILMGGMLTGPRTATNSTLAIGGFANEVRFWYAFIAAALLLIGGWYTLKIFHEDNYGSRYPLSTRAIIHVKSWYPIPLLQKPDPWSGGHFEKELKEYVKGWTKDAANYNAMILEDLETVFSIFNRHNAKRHSVNQMTQTLWYFFSLAIAMLLCGVIIELVNHIRPEFEMQYISISIATPIVLIAIAIMAKKKYWPKIKQAITLGETEKPDSKTSMFCRYCGVKIPRDSKFCDHCGATIS